jgi:hypothetical protein
LKNRRFWAEIAEIRGDFAKALVNFPVPGILARFSPDLGLVFGCPDLCVSVVKEI